MAARRAAWASCARGTARQLARRRSCHCAHRRRSDNSARSERGEGGRNSLRCGLLGASWKAGGGGRGRGGARGIWPAGLHRGGESLRWPGLFVCLFVCCVVVSSAFQIELGGFQGYHFRNMAKLRGVLYMAFNVLGSVDSEGTLRSAIAASLLYSLIPKPQAPLVRPCPPRPPLPPFLALSRPLRTSLWWRLTACLTQRSCARTSTASRTWSAASGRATLETAGTMTRLTPTTGPPPNLAPSTTEPARPLRLARSHARTLARTHAR